LKKVEKHWIRGLDVPQNRSGRDGEDKIFAPPHWEHVIRSCITTP